LEPAIPAAQSQYYKESGGERDFEISVVIKTIRRFDFAFALHHGVPPPLGIERIFGVSKGAVVVF
jgi:hypothetical protein